LQWNLHQIVYSDGPQWHHGSPTAVGTLGSAVSRARNPRLSLGHVLPSNWPFLGLFQRSRSSFLQRKHFRISIYQTWVTGDQRSKATRNSSQRIHKHHQMRMVQQPCLLSAPAILSTKYVCNVRAACKVCKAQSAGCALCKCRTSELRAVFFWD